MLDQTSRMKFHAWLASNNKHYTNNTMYMEAMYNWLVVEELIQNQNFLADQSGDPDFLRLGHNFFSDWTNEDKVKHLLGAVAEDSEAHDGGVHDDIYEWINEGPVEQTWAESMEVDWVARGNVGPIKSQGGCGSCYAFSATTNFEAMLSIATGEPPIRVSEQHMVDCFARGYEGSIWGGNYGCSGGWENECWNGYQQHGGAIAYNDYTYTGTEDDCKMDGKTRVAQVEDWGRFGKGKPYEMVAKMQEGPISIHLKAGCDKFFAYSSGIIKFDDCPRDTIDHAVVGVAFNPNGATGDYYGTTGGTPYIRIQNSWGAWGDNGFANVEVRWDDEDGTSAMHHNPAWVKAYKL